MYIPMVNGIKALSGLSSIFRPSTMHRIGLIVKRAKLEIGMSQSSLLLRSVQSLLPPTEDFFRVAAAAVETQFESETRLSK